MMLQDYDGAAIVDATGQRIGAVERSYVDDRGTARFVAVKIGALRAKQRLIPVASAQSTESGLVVPYTKDSIVASPDASSAGDLLEGALLEQVRAYYAGGRESRAGDTDDRTTTSGGAAAAVPIAQRGGQDTAIAASDTAPQAGAVRDRGDVIEIPIMEDEVVTRPVVKEVLRVRKERVTEPQTIQATLRKEDVQITHDGDVVVRDETR